MKIQVKTIFKRTGRIKHCFQDEQSPFRPNKSKLIIALLVIKVKIFLQITNSKRTKLKLVGMILMNKQLGFNPNKYGLILILSSKEEFKEMKTVNPGLEIIWDDDLKVFDEIVIAGIIKD